jgi:hypothetical protein
MQTVTPLFLQALTTSHQISVKADVYYGGALLAADIPVADGAVTLDRGSRTRRALSLTVADVSYLPWTETDPLAVYGQQIVVTRGIRYMSGQEERVPLGTFRIDNPQGDTLYGPVSLTGSSSEVYIQDDRFTVPTSTRGYATCVDAITGLIHQTLPSATVVNTTGRNPSCAVVSWDAQADRWDAITQIATSMNAEIYVDALDRFVIANAPNVISGSVAWDVAEGEGGVLMSAARQMSRTAVYNAVVASGENTSSNVAPVSAIARDTDPTSPTRWGGPFGRVTKFYSSALLGTVTACQSVADTMLFDATAPNVLTSITAIPNPALEAGDVLRLSYARRRELALLQAVSIPLTATGTGSLTLRGSKVDDS